MSDKYNKEEPSVIQKIQSQTGCLLLVIGIAMLAFVLTDLVSSRTSIFSNTSNSIGSINGEPVEVQEYNAIYDQLKQNLEAQNPGMQLSEAFLASYKQRAWNMLVQEKLVTLEYDKAGMDVTGDEMEDLTIGDNTHPQLRNAFKNPETNQFDKSQLVRYLTEIIENDPTQKQQWLTYESQLIKDIKGEKYRTLANKLFYGTELEATRELKDEQQSLTASLVGVSYDNIADSSITVSDAEIRSYVKEHRSQFEQEASRDIEFVSFDIIPSKEDTNSTEEWIAENYDKFKAARNDSMFVANSLSETPFDTAFKIRGTFTPAEIDNAVFDGDSGDVIGPFENEGVYALFKISNVGEDSLKSVRASHILISIAGRTKEDTTKAQAEARQLLGDIRAGKTTFADEARNKNLDGTGAQGGDLGWLREGSRKAPKEFVEKALNTANGGYFIVTTRNGVHIGKTTSNVSRKTIQVARLTQTVEAGSETDREYYRMAGEFLAKAKGASSFEDLAEEMGYTKRVSKKITEKERRVSGVTNGNIVARWLFDASTDEGDVSDIIEVDGKYLVAHCTKIREKGLPDVDDIRSDVEPVVRNLKKAEQIKERFENALESATDAESLAKALETVVTPIPAAIYGEGNLPYIGKDDYVVGALFGTSAGERTDILVGKTGVYVGYISSYNQFEIPSDMDNFRTQFTGKLNEMVDAQIEESLLEIGKVKDQRYKFFNE